MSAVNVKTCVVGLALAAATAIGSAPSANADDPWLAIAYSPMTDRWGWETVAKSPIEAINTSMNFCSSHGANDCRVLVTNQGGCVALAKSSGGEVKGGRGPDRNSAARDAFNSVLGGGIIPLNKCVGD